MEADFHRPAWRIAGSSMPAATMSWAAPTRAECPERPRTTESVRPALRAIRLKMRPTWPGGRVRPVGLPPLSSERNRTPTPTSTRLLQSFTRLRLSGPTRTTSPLPSPSVLERRTSRVPWPPISSSRSETCNEISSERRRMAS